MNPTLEALYLKRRAEAKAKRDREGEVYLSEQLANGPALVASLKLEAKRRGVSWASVRLARYTLGVRSILAQVGQVWKLPDVGRKDKS
jgi:hypothetical protein